MKNDPTFKFVALAIVAALALAFLNPSHAGTQNSQSPTPSFTSQR